MHSNSYPRYFALIAAIFGLLLMSHSAKATTVTLTLSTNTGTLQNGSFHFSATTNVILTGAEKIQAYQLLKLDDNGIWQLVSGHIWTPPQNTITTWGANLVVFSTGTFHFKTRITLDNNTTVDSAEQTLIVS